MDLAQVLLSTDKKRIDSVFYRVNPLSLDFIINGGSFEFEFQLQKNKITCFMYIISIFPLSLILIVVCIRLNKRYTMCKEN